MGFDEYDDIVGGGMMGDGKEDPKEQRKKLYTVIFLLNFVLNFIYYFLKIFLNNGPFRIIEALLTTFPTGWATLNIALFVQVGVTFFLGKALLHGQRKKTKENILGVLASANFILCLVLIAAAYRSYVETDRSLGAFFVILLIVSIVIFGITSKGLFKNIKEVVDDYRNKEEEVEDEEDEEESIGKYDWIKTFYDPNQNENIVEDLEYYRFHSPGSVFFFLITHINQTLLLEKEKLVNKDVVKAGNQADNVVQVDYPIINSQDDIDELVEKEDFGFSNPYVIINNSYVAFKLKTVYLSNPKRLQEIGEEILPTQKSDAIKQVPFKPLVPLEPGDDLYSKMVEGGKMSSGKITKNTLFQNIGIQKIKNDWYVVFSYTEWYKKTVTFHRLQPLPEVLEEETDGFGTQKINPKLLFGYRSEGGYLGLNLKQIRHLIFGGQSGSGKSVYLSSIIYQILYLANPKAVKLVLIDPLKVSFRPFKKIAHLFSPVAMTEEEAVEAINLLVEENKNRYSFLEALGYEDIYEYNSDIGAGILKMVDQYGLSTKRRISAKKDGKNASLEAMTEIELEKLQEGVGKRYKVGRVLPQIVLIYDEFNAYNGNALYEKNRTVDKLVKLGEQARKAGIILILGTQKIDADSVPSRLRENFPTRVALKVASSFNSRAILGEQAENKSEGRLLTGSGDMLVYNGEALNLTNAERAQGFYVSKEAMDELLRRNFEEYGMNDFVYKEKETDTYKWLEVFYNPEKEDIQEMEKKRGLSLIPSYLVCIDHINAFFKSSRTEVLDKESLENESKNIEIDTLRYSTEDELQRALGFLDFNNQYFNLTTSYLDIKLNTQFLSSSDKLLKLEENLNLKLGKLQESVQFTPVKEISEESEDYREMAKEGVPFQLIDNFEFTRDKNSYFIRLNFTKFYKKHVIFPNSQTIPQILMAEAGDKIAALKRGVVYIIGKGEIEIEE